MLKINSSSNLSKFQLHLLTRSCYNPKEIVFPSAQSYHLSQWKRLILKISRLKKKLMMETGNIHAVLSDNKNVKMPVFMANRGHSCVERTSQIVFSELSERAVGLIFPLSRPHGQPYFSPQYTFLVPQSSMFVTVFYRMHRKIDPFPFTRRKICTLRFRFEGFSHLSFKVNIKKKKLLKNDSAQ